MRIYFALVGRELSTRLITYVPLDDATRIGFEQQNELISHQRAARSSVRAARQRLSVPSTQ
ncbi:hypothetical protein BS297_27405 [Rhodococcus erythropolis]|uniref:Uncharacterized protein n=1 Tax=Rhodococcus erythropolis TaxID=1833 RepID=A0A0C3ABQ1_RHOER|nr:hypothetical protein BS297_27405 [Rhodococcus erythropolis]KIM17504.1 hypothetical protein QV65_04485 [Rhodococcus erythropolis]